MIKEITEKEYKNFLKKFDDTLFFQSVEWAIFKAKTEWNKCIIGFFENEKLKASAILLYRKVPIINKRIYYSPRGFILDFNDFDLIHNFTDELKIYLKKNKGILLKINPYVKYVLRDKDGNIIGEKNDKLLNHLKKLGYTHNGLYIDAKDKKDLEPRWLSVLDVQKDLDTLLKEMRQTTRWMINKSEKNCITIKDASYDDLGEFKKVMNHTAERREFIDRPLSYYELMYKELSKNDMIRILMANINLKEFRKVLLTDIENLSKRIEVIKDNVKKKNQILEYQSQIDSMNKKVKNIDEEIERYGDNPVIAVGLYISYGSQIVYLFGGSYKEFMSYGAQYLMQYEMIKYAKEKGYKKLNFYGIDGNFNKDSEGYGLFDFKRGFNSDVVELIGEFDLIVNKFDYKLYKFMLKMYGKLRKIKNN